MPSLQQIAMRYFVWMVGLSLINQVAANLLALPQSQAVAVMLAAVPALVVANYVTQNATRRMALSDWAVAWGIMMAIYLGLRVIVPIALSSTVRAGLANPGILSQIVVVVAAVGVMLALFLFIGQLLSKRQT